MITSISTETSAKLARTKIIQNKNAVSTVFIEISSRWRVSERKAIAPESIARQFRADQDRQSEIVSYGSGTCPGLYQAGRLGLVAWLLPRHYFTPDSPICGGTAFPTDKILLD